MVFDHVGDAALNGLGAQGHPGAESLLRFTDTRDVLLSAPRVLTPAGTCFSQAEGAACANIIVDGGDLTKAAQPLVVARGAAESQCACAARSGSGRGFLRREELGEKHRGKQADHEQAHHHDEHRRREQQRPPGERPAEKPAERREPSA